MEKMPKKSQSLSVSEARRERERAELTERIMDAAREMFVRDGYEAVTLRKIALAIEYSPAAIYQYFKDKRALVQAIIRRDSDDLRAHLHAGLNQETPVEQLVEMARLYAEWGVAHPNHYRLMLAPPLAPGEDDREPERNDPTSLGQEILTMLWMVVQGAIERGTLKEKYTDPALVAATLWAGIHGLVLLEINETSEERARLGGADTPFEARFATLVSVFLDGFLRQDAGDETAAG